MMMRQRAAPYIIRSDDASAANVFGAFPHAKPFRILLEML